MWKAGHAEESGEPPPAITAWACVWVAVRLNAEPGAVGPITSVKTKALPGVAPYPCEQSVPSGSRPLSNPCGFMLVRPWLGMPSAPCQPSSPICFHVALENGLLLSPLRSYLWLSTQPQACPTSVSDPST